MNEFYTRITSCGVTAKATNQANKRVKLLNIYTLIWIHLTIIFTITDLAQGILFERIFFGHFITALTFFNLCVIIYLNYIYKFSWARGLFVITAFIVFNSSSLIVSPGIYTEYYFFLLPGLGLSLFDQKWITVSILISSIVFFFLPYHIWNLYPIDYTERLDYPSMTCLFIALYFLFNYFKKLNQQNEQLLELERDRVISDKIVLEKQEKKLRELNDFKSHFFVNLSHEIRTPLTLIQGYVSQITKKTSQKEVEEKLAVVKEQTNQMQSIINNIMDLSKMDAKQFSISTQKVEVHLFLEKIYTNFKQLFDKKEISFSLKPIAKEIFIEIDSDLFQKAITNLLSNALKFTPKGGNVILHSVITKNHFQIDIIDSGIGIPVTELGNIFKRFYQVKNDITKSKGSGIGLAFTKNIIEAHDFKIIVSSEENKGAKFSIQIPNSLCDFDDEKSKTLLATKSIDSANPEDAIKVFDSSTNIPKILVVEDHEQMRKYIKSVLSDYEVCEAENGKEALEKMKVQSYDLILTDYMMPVMDGEVFVKKVKQLKDKTPILVLTARTDNHGKLNMLRMGIDGYLQKPFLEEELLLQIKNGLKLYANTKVFEKNLQQEEKASLEAYAEKFNSKINDFITNNLVSNTLNVEEIAMHLNMSRSTLNRKTKAVLGQSTKDLIMEARLQKARTLMLENPHATKKEISAKVGISNTSYLFQKLEERFGVSI